MPSATPARPPRPRRRQLIEWLGNQPPGPADTALVERLQAAFTGASESQVRAALRACGRALQPLAEGVRQESFAALQRTLSALSAEYEAGDATLRQRIRRLVLTAKQHATLAARNPRLAPERRADKQEMRQWLLTWLENPPLFPVWSEMRRRTCAESTDAL